ncbi:hypothetical protein Gohar_006009 [Gossypium harknessii]|uniref:DUF4283 domain-containing protein n=1 Tax=Gossypium harknessii TaxID=34285 RepID=A0A7J9GC02_9ROSI|nr:hypothetical protein [Gossypium harknessii]
MEKRMVDLSIEDGEEAWLLPASVGHFLAVRDTMANLWHPLGELDVDRVITSAPWTFNNHILVIHRLKEDEDPMQVPLVFSSFRIQVHDLPLGFFSGFVAK